MVIAEISAFPSEGLPDFANGRSEFFGEIQYLNTVVTK